MAEILGIFNDRLFVFAMLGAVIVFLRFFGGKDSSIGARFLNKHIKKAKQASYVILAIFALIAVAFFSLVAWVGIMLLLTAVLHVPSTSAFVIASVAMFLMLLVITARHFWDDVQAKLFRRRRRENEKNPKPNDIERGITQTMAAIHSYHGNN